MTKVYLGYFDYFATGEGMTTFMWVFDLEEGEDKCRKFYDRLSDAADWYKPKPEEEDRGFEYFKIGFKFFNTQKAGDLKKIKKIQSLPVRTELLDHVWLTQKRFKGVPYKLEFFSHLNVS